jgi:hypothetical protein
MLGWVRIAALQQKVTWPSDATQCFGFLGLHMTDCRVLYR